MAPVVLPAPTSSTKLRRGTVACICIGITSNPCISGKLVLLNGRKAQVQSHTKCGLRQPPLLHGPPTLGGSTEQASMFRMTLQGHTVRLTLSVSLRRKLCGGCCLVPQNWFVHHAVLLCGSGLRRVSFFLTLLTQLSTEVRGTNGCL